MKILFFIEDLGPGGKQRRLVELIKGLSKTKKFEMELVIMDDNIFYDDVLKTGIKIHYTKRKSMKKDPRVFLKFYRTVKKIRPDVINVWGNMSAIYALPAKRLLNIPMVNNQIADAGLHTSSSLLSYRLTFPFSDKIVANSHAGLKAYNAPSDKSMVIHNGFDFDRIGHLRDKDEVRKELNIKTKYVVGMAASYMSRKDYATYIKAANEILKKKNDITFVCVGDGDSTQFSQMVEPDNKNRILVLGWKPNVESIMNAFDIGVLATFTEGISNTILEYMALSKPVVATDGGGTKELVDNGSTGFLVKERAPEELMKHIMYFLENENDRIDFGKKGREKIEQEFSIEKMISNFSDLFENIINDKKKVH